MNFNYEHKELEKDAVQNYFPAAEVREAEDIDRVGFLLSENYHIHFQ